MAISLEDLKSEDAFKSPQELSAEQEAQEAQENVEPVEAPAPEPEPQEAESVAQVEEPVAETPPAEPAKEEPAEEPQTEQFNFEFFNKQIGKNYESLEQVKADLEKPTMESEYETAKTQLEELQAKVTEYEETQRLLIEQTDPTTFFSSNDAMKAEVFKKQHPKKDASIVEKVFSTGDLSSIDDIEMVKMGWKFNSSKSLGTDAKIEAAIKEELNADPDTPTSELPETAQVRLTKMADEYRNAFDQMKKDISLPEKIDLEKLKADHKEANEKFQTALNEGWTKLADETLKSTSKLDIPIGVPKEGEEQQFFQWDLGEAPKDDVERLKNNFIELGMKPEGEAQELFQKSLELELINKNLPQIMKKHEDDIIARKEKEHLEKTHNPEPLKDSQRSEDTDAEKIRKERSAFALGGAGPVIQGHPLFTIKK